MDAQYVKEANEEARRGKVHSITQPPGSQQKDGEPPQYHRILAQEAYENMLITLKNHSECEIKLAQEAYEMVLEKIDEMTASMKSTGEGSSMSLKLTLKYNKDDELVSSWLGSVTLPMKRREHVGELLQGELNFFS